MTSPELMQSWVRSAALLNQAIAQLSPLVGKKNEAALLEATEFLDNNELGLAFVWLRSIAQDDRWDSKKLLSTLLLAAENMGLVVDARGIKERILELK